MALILCIHAQTSEAAEKLAPGLLLTLKKPTSVYAQPSAKSKILADVDANTLVILKKSSPKKLWIYVEDEDGNGGWVPSVRTNFTDILAQQRLEARLQREEKLSQSKEDDEENQSAQREEKQALKNQASHELGFLGRRGFPDPNGRWGLGLYYRYMSPPVLISGKETSQSSRLGIESGYLNFHNDFSIPLRMKWLSRKSDSLFVMGPDIGIFFMRIKSPNKSLSRWSASLGYCAGISPLDTGFSLLLRGGLEFFHNNRTSLELTTGWVF